MSHAAPAHPTRLLVLTLAATTLAACATGSASAERDRIDPDLTSRARGCEGTRVVEVRNDSPFAVDVYGYRYNVSNPVFLRTLGRGAVEQIPLESDVVRVRTQPSRQAGAPAGSRDQVQFRYLCRDGA